MQGVQWITGELLEQVLEEARSSPRRRTNFNFHQSMEENPHRFLNVMLRGTYVRPHHHTSPPKSESFLIIDGSVAFCLFDEKGNLAECKLVGRDLPEEAPICTEYGIQGGLQSHGLGVDIVPGLWHTLLVLSNEAICFEVKPGPYKPSTDKEFADWAPAEGQPETHAFLEELEARALRFLQGG